MREGSHHSEEAKKKISEKLRGNLNRVEHGRRSRQVREEQPVACDSCSLSERCPAFVRGAVCSLNSEVVGLAEQLGGDKFFDHTTLCRFLGAILQINAIRFTRGVNEESTENLGLDDSVTKLSKTLFDQVGRLARLLGFDRRDPKVLIDARTQTVNIQDMSESDFARVLNALSEIRQVDNQLAERLLAGEPIALPERTEEE